MIPDVTLNGKSIREMGWIRENIDFPTPQSQTNTIVVPGRNSPIRYTEALGRVSYQPRSFTIVLSILGTRKQYDQKVSELVNQYAGKLIKVIRSEEPDVYALGTVEFAPVYDPLLRKGTITLECTDGDSYFYHVKESEVVISGSGTVILQNDFMPVVPVVITTGAVSYTHLDVYKRQRPSIESETKEDTIEPGTETLSITADPRSDGLVKARTGDTTDETTYKEWYKTVYTPTEEGGAKA